MNGKSRWMKRAIASFLVLAVIATLCLGCGDDEEKEGVTITIGEISDFTGVASPAVKTIHYALADAARYYNEEGLIPGVKIKIVSYDTKYDPSREVPAYDWVRGQGAQLIVSVYPTTGEILKPFAERDKIVVTNMSATMPQIEPPGWVYCFNCPSSWGFPVVMKWISEEHWDWQTQGPAKIGYAGWHDPYSQEVVGMIEGYCQSHPEKFEWVESFLSPMGTMIFGNEAEKLKDCDYVASFGTPVGYFLKEFRTRGYTAPLFDSCSAPAYLGFLVDMVGWQGIDGTLTVNPAPIWEEPFPVIELAEELLHKYHPEGEAEDIIYAGSSYVGSFVQIVTILDLLRAAVEEVGAENFGGEAYYDAAVKYKTAGPLWEGFPQWSFSETKRYLVNHFLVYEFDADEEDLVRRSEWLPELQ